MPVFTMAVGECNIHPLVMAVRRRILPEVVGSRSQQVNTVLDGVLVFVQEAKYRGGLRDIGIPGHDAGQETGAAIGVLRVKLAVKIKILRIAAVPNRAAIVD